MPIFPPMTPADAGKVAYRVRALHRRGDLTHADLALADALIWAARKPGTAAAIVSYSALCRLAHVARGTVAAGLRRLEGLGIIQRIKRRVHVAWGQGASASRQAVSAYVLQAGAGTEFNGQPVSQSVKILPLAAAAVQAAQDALAARRRAVEGRLLMNAAGPRALCLT
jgi:hypothetical protein